MKIVRSNASLSVQGATAGISLSNAIATANNNTLLRPRPQAAPCSMPGIDLQGGTFTQMAARSR